MDLVNSSQNYAQMADVLRYEILLKYGGVYLDTDFECLRNIDPILVGVRNFACSEDGRSISVSIIGAMPNSIYMVRSINALPDKIGQVNTAMETGPGLLTRVLLDGGLAEDFTLFPRKWFYPYRCHELHRVNEHFPDAYAVHRWDGSWGDSDNRFFTRVYRKIKSMLRRYSVV
jgi:mannosyltransferase OCH1-like enzyme